MNMITHIQKIIKNTKKLTRLHTYSILYDFIKNTKKLTTKVVGYREIT